MPPTARPARCTATSAARTACCSRWSSSGSTSRASGISADVEGASDLDGRLRATLVRLDGAGPDDADGEPWLLLEFELWLHAARNPAFGDDARAPLRRLRDLLAPPSPGWAKDEDLGRLRHPPARRQPDHRPARSARRCNSASIPTPSRPPTSSPVYEPYSRRTHMHVTLVSSATASTCSRTRGPRGVPYDQFELLRREAPVFWHEHPERAGLLGGHEHDDVKAISRDHETFSAELGLDVHPRPGPEAASRSSA